MRTALTIVCLSTLVAATAAAQPSAPLPPDCEKATTHEAALEAIKLLGSLNNLGSGPDDLEYVPNVADLPAYFVRLHAARETLHCAGPSLNGPEAQSAAMVARFVDTELPKYEAATTTELACRAADKCMAVRVCDAQAHRKDLASQVAREKANPAGVVDLELLHNLGEGIQADDALIAFRSKNFKTWRHKAFSPSLCK